MFRFYKLFILLMAIGTFGQDVGPIVTINQGNVVGSIADDGDYWNFFGIPYAGSTEGHNRFKAPTEAPEFDDIFFANRADIKCVRVTSDGYEGEEDCLVLNIYTPSLDEAQNVMPVMVWIGDTEFRDGEPDLSFKSIVEQGVVVVKVNYRESIFGFLCLGTDEAPGNAGLKDIIAALKWIQKNIETFRGDPTSVTLFGNGFGGVAVDLITLSPASEGLVHKAITQSGNALSPWSVKYDPRVNARSVVEQLGHYILDESEIVPILLRTSIGAIAGVLREFELTDNSLVFGPCIENIALDDQDAVVIESPLQTLQSGDYTPIPYITGFVENEGTIREAEASNSNWLDKMDTSFVDFLQSDLEFANYEERLSLAANIRAYYFESRSIDSYSISDYLKYHGDTMIIVSSIRNAWTRASTSSEPVYLYQFSYDGSHGTPWKGDVLITGPTHGEELGYIFDVDVDDDISTQDKIMKTILIERWTNFAKTGVPYSSLETATEWQPVDFNNINYLQIINADGDELPLEVSLVNPQSEKMAFWDHIYETFYRQVSSVWDYNARNNDEDNQIDDGENENDGLVGSGDGNEGDDNPDNDNPDPSESSSIRHVAVLMTIFSALAVHIIE